MNSQEKIRENFSRRHADRLGLKLQKSYAKRWSLNDQQGYKLSKFDNTNFAGEQFELMLDQVEALLDEYEKKLRQQ